MRALPDAVMRDDARPLLVGYSGGLDSTVLLHWLAAHAQARRAGLRAIHVHHGLHAEADAWAAHCQRVCDALGIQLLVERVAVDAPGLGREGAARHARHAAFARQLGEGEVLALAHHRDDQAETFLLRALRGSGVDGLAAMRPWRAYAHGWLWRPLLETSRDALRAHAETHGLSWIEDPSNHDASLDRNFLRAQVLPLLRTRWPHAAAALARSAGLAAEATLLLEHDDVQALAAAEAEDGSLALSSLHALPAERRSRVLRRWVAGLGLPALPASGIACIESDLLQASDDAQARFDWAGASIRRWRGHLHAHRIPDAWPAGWSRQWDGAQVLPLPTGGILALRGAAGLEAPLRVHARQGGERILLPGRVQQQSLKHVLQDQGVPPWRRAGMPLLTDAGGTLQAAGTIVAAGLSAWLQAHGARLDWQPAAMP